MYPNLESQSLLKENVLNTMKTNMLFIPVNNVTVLYLNIIDSDNVWGTSVVSSKGYSSLFLSLYNYQVYLWPSKIKKPWQSFKLWVPIIFKLNITQFICFGLWFACFWTLSCPFVSLGIRLLEAMVEFGQSGLC